MEYWVTDGSSHLRLRPGEFGGRVLDQTEIGELHQYRPAVEDFHQYVLETDVPVEQPFAVKVVDAVEELQRDPLPCGER